MSAPSKFKSKSDNCDEDPPKKRQRTNSPPRFAPSQWITLNHNPGRPSSVPPGSVNINNEYILVNCRHALYVYEITTGLWQHWTEKCNFGYKGSNMDISVRDMEPIVYCPESNGLIICNAHHTSHQGNLFAVIKDLNSNDHQLNSWQFISAASEWCRTSALFIKENDEIHLFGGITCTKHRFFCTKDIAQPDTWCTGYVHRDRNIVQHGVVYIHSQHRMLFFGGRDRGGRHYMSKAFDTIWEYDFRKPRSFAFEHQWEKFHRVKLPHKMYGFGYILTADERYIVIFGGVIINEDMWGKPRWDRHSDKIFVMDVATMTIVQSQVICPQSGPFRATSIVKGNEKLVTGFIRRHVMEYGLKISSDLCKLINCWYNHEEYVHLMSSQLHWKMNMKEIISNIRAD